MSGFEIAIIIVWSAVPVVLVPGLYFKWATDHPGGRVDRTLERIFIR